MSAAAVQDVAPAIEAAPAEVEWAAAAAVEVEWAACACCGLREECTAAYASGVRAQYAGQWLCGLCGDAVGEELVSGGVGVGGSSAMAEVEAAIARHAAFCRSAPAAAERLIAAVRRLLRNGSGRKAKAVVVLEFQDS